MSEVRDFLDALNRARRSTWCVAEELSHGYMQGAYLVINHRGDRAVLKWGSAPNVIAGVRRSAPIVRRARAAGWPTPEWLGWGVVAGNAYYLQSYLPGLNLLDVGLDQHLLQQLLQINDLQAGLGPSGPQEWSRYSQRVIFENEYGYASGARNYSAASAELLDQIDRVMRPLRRLQIPEDDLVHGDLALSNVMTDGGQVAGIVDVTSVGRGTRVYDLARIAVVLDDSALVETISAHALDRVSHGVWLTCLACQMIDWTSCGASFGWPAEDVDALVRRAARLLVREAA